MEYVKAGGKTQSQLDTEAAEQEAEREQNEAIAKIRDRQAVMARLELWLMRYVWPRLTTEEKAEIRQIIPEGMEDEIKAALGKLP